MVLAGSGSHLILKDKPGILHVLIIAPQEARISAIMEQEGVSRKIAERRVKENDDARSAYYRSYYKVDWLDCSLYDLSINTGPIPRDVAVEVITRTAQGLP